MNATDLLAILGVAALAVGSAIVIQPAAALMVVGLALIALAFLIARSSEVSP